MNQTTRLSNRLRRNPTAIEIVLLAVIIGIIATYVATISVGLAVLVATYFAAGAVILRLNTKRWLASRIAIAQPPRDHVPPLQFTIGLFLGSPLAIISLPYMAWLLTAGWAFWFGAPPVETIATYMAGPLAEAEIGLALGLYMVACSINIIFGWAVWSPVESANPWLRLLEAVAGSHLTTLALVLTATWSLISPAMWLFFAAVEIGYIHITMIFWASEKAALLIINRVRAWRAA